jgi:hypothetical protein
VDLLLTTVAATVAAIEPADPTGLAQGRYPAPAWLIWLAAGAVVALAAVILVIRLLRARRG